MKNTGGGGETGGLAGIDDMLQKQGSRSLETANFRNLVERAASMGLHKYCVTPLSKDVTDVDRRCNSDERNRSRITSTMATPV